MQTTGRINSISMIHIAMRTRTNRMMKHELDQGGAYSPVHKEKQMNNTAYVSLKDVSLRV